MEISEYIKALSLEEEERHRLALCDILGLEADLLQQQQFATTLLQSSAKPKRVSVDNLRVEFRTDFKGAIHQFVANQPMVVICGEVSIEGRPVTFLWDYTGFFGWDWMNFHRPYAVSGNTLDTPPLSSKNTFNDGE